MPRKSMDTLTESMFYVLMALTVSSMCGIEITSWISRRTNNRVHLGPATLYTILAKFEKEEMIKEICVEGRKRTYQITENGLDAYNNEIERLSLCLSDARRKNHELEENLAMDTLSIL